MARKEHIVKYTAEELEAMRARGESKSNWAKADAMTEEEIEAAIASDPDEASMEIDWSKAIIYTSPPKSVLNMRVDADIMDCFRKQGKGYQTKINAILRSYVEHANNNA